MPWPMCTRGQSTTLWGSFFYLFMVPGIKLKSPNLPSKLLYPLTHLVGPNCELIFCFLFTEWAASASTAGGHEGSGHYRWSPLGLLKGENRLSTESSPGAAYRASKERIPSVPLAPPLIGSGESC